MKKINTTFSFFFPLSLHIECFTYINFLTISVACGIVKQGFMLSEDIPGKCTIFQERPNSLGELEYLVRLESALQHQQSICKNQIATLISREKIGVSHI